MVDVSVSFSAVPLQGSAKLGGLRANGTLTVKNPSIWRRINIKDFLACVASLTVIARMLQAILKDWGIIP